MTTTREDKLELTPQQKLEALSLRFYQGLTWEPKAGDHYTTSRADLELYQVVSVEDGVIKTRYCNNKTTAISEWQQDGFLSEGFGLKRVWVPDFVLSMQPAADTRVDLINRMDAVQACQVGPSDEWAKATKDGYNQAAADCAFNILKIKPAIIGTATPAPSDKIAEAARKAHEALWELNPDNYTHDDVVNLNDASVDAIFILADAIGETHGKTPEWWEARRAALRALAGKGE